jgi:uncharacterized protein YjbI with pentapeptide repeats
VSGVVNRRQEQRHKRQLIERMRSGDNADALRALFEFRAYGWLYDGTLNRADLTRAALDHADLSGGDLRRVRLNEASLCGADLRQADLERAHLFGADLSGANLAGASLRGAYLAAANLTGSGLSDQDLVVVSGLIGAVMPDGSRYDGRFNLPGDLDPARIEVDAGNDAASMAAWYGVPVEVYDAGQEWARQHLEALRHAGL